MKVLVVQFVVLSLLVVGGPSEGECRKLGSGSGESYSQSKLYVTMEQPQVEVVDEDPQKNLGGLDEGEETTYDPETYLLKKNVMYGEKVQTSEEVGRREEYPQKPKNSTKPFQKVYKELPYRVTSMTSKTTSTVRSVSSSRATPTKVSVRRVPPPQTTVKYHQAEVTTPTAETTTSQTYTLSRKTVKPVRVVTKTTLKPRANPTYSPKPIHYIITVIGDEKSTTSKPAEGTTSEVERVTEASIATSVANETTTVTSQPEGSTQSSVPLSPAEIEEPAVTEPESPKADVPSEPPNTLEPESNDDEIIEETEEVGEPSTTTPGPYDHLQVVKIPPSAISDFFSPPRPAFVKSIGHYVPPNGHYRPLKFIQETADYSPNYNFQRPLPQNSNYFNNFIQSEQPFPFRLTPQELQENIQPSQLFNSGNIIKSEAQEDYFSNDSNQGGRLVGGLRPPQNIQGGFLVQSQNIGQDVPSSNGFQAIPLTSSLRFQDANTEDAVPFFGKNFQKSANSAANALPIENSKNVVYFTQVSPGGQSQTSQLLIQNPSSSVGVTDNFIEKGDTFSGASSDKISSPIAATSFYLDTTAQRLLPVPGSVIGKPIPQLVDIRYN